MVNPIHWKGDRLELIDQRILPFEQKMFVCQNVDQTVFAIRDMVVRGAPAIGVTAAYGLVLGLLQDPTEQAFQIACDQLAASRPTAVNLFDAIAYMQENLGPIDRLENPAAKAEKLAIAYHQEDLQKNKEIGKHGAKILPSGQRVLTHCNAGALATSGWGTALGVVRQLQLDDKLKLLYADETRPFLQGARLTAWECGQDDIPCTLITDGMSGHLMSKGMIDCVIVGSDRIAANGDVANKIGTFMVAMAAKYHGIPFIVAAPTTTIDRNCATGAEIPIEQRPVREVSHVRDNPIVDEGTSVLNPAFDVTPAELVSAIITEEGVFRFPYDFTSK